MHSSPVLPAWIRGIGILAIVFDVSVLLVCVVAFLITLVFLPAAYGAGIALAIFVWPCCFVAASLSIFQIVAAIGLLRPRRGARTIFIISTGGTALLPALIFIFFGLMGLPSSIYSHTAILLSEIAVVAVFLVCLLLFTRPHVVSAFEAAAALPPPIPDSTVPSLPPTSPPRAPTSSQEQRSASCPTSVLVVAILLMISGIQSLLSLLVFHKLGSASPTPVFFFGAVFRSETARLIETLIPILLAMLALALFLLNRYALDFILILQALRVINTFGAVVSLTFVHALWESAAQSSARNWAAGPSWLRGGIVIQLLYSLALLLILGASRDRFIKAVKLSRHLPS